MSTSGSPPVYRALRGHKDPGLVTGEGVLLDIPAASFPQRMLSALVDVSVTVAGLFACLLLLSLDDLEPVLAQSVGLLLVIFWLLAVPVATETLSRGRSLGKVITGTRTVRDDGGPIVLRHALTRGLFGVLEIYATAGAVAIVTGLATERSRRLGDLAAGTAVVRVRSRLDPSAPPQMPPPLAHWASTADMAPLPDALALGIRQLLLRQHVISPGARQTLARDLLSECLPYVSPPPPPGHDDEVVLAAILAHRREQDAARLARDEQLRQRVTYGRTP